MTQDDAQKVINLIMESSPNCNRVGAMMARFATEFPEHSQDAWHTWDEKFGKVRPERFSRRRAAVPSRGAIARRSEELGV